MDALSSSSSKNNLTRKPSVSGSHRDLCVVAHEGSLCELESVIQQLKKNGGNINLRNVYGLTPLHIATWRNQVPIVKKLLAAGADPDCRDGESGWSSLHRALHFGHLAVASVLLRAGASLTLEDSKCRTPVDLLSGPLMQIIGKDHDSVATEIFCWGSGTNYQLGTGNAHIQKLPGKVDALQGTFTKIVAAAKYHSVAVGSRGELYTWGFGRGGRLGHPEFDIHSGQAAVITPRQVTSGLASRKVKTIAAAKHHMVVATQGGEVFTWGSNREGQLGYTSVDTQPTPRRVSSLRTKIVAVAAANKHSAAVSESGEVFTWGCNKDGQLGYGTSNSASNYTPRVVEYLKGKVLSQVSAAKCHTIVVSADGEVYTWGHRLVTPRRVVVARNVRKCGSIPLKFHRKERLHVTSIAAGMVHSMALTEDGSLFYWVSSDAELKCHQLYSMCGKNLVSISAGKYWSAAVTSTGDVYMWDGKKFKGETPVPTRLHGVKRASSVSVGETHLLVISSLYHPTFAPKLTDDPQKSKLVISDQLAELDDDFMFYEDTRTGVILERHDSCDRPVPTLKCLCERVAAESLAEPRNALQLLEIADSLGAHDLRKHCEEIAIRNLDYIFTVSAPAVASAAPEILANLEKSLDLRSTESWSSRRLPTPTAPFPVVIDSEEEDGCDTSLRLRNSNDKIISKNFMEMKSGFLQHDCAVDQKNDKQVRALRKKLQQIEILETKQLSGYLLDNQQHAKLHSKQYIENALAELGFPVDREVLTEGKENDRKVETSRKQRRKIKQRMTQVESFSSNLQMPREIKSIKGFPDMKNSLPKFEEADMDVRETVGNQASEKCLLESRKDKVVTQNDRKFDPPLSKKKNRKGGLSMFLSGALDGKPKDVAPPTTPKCEGPAWGGAKILKGLPSFRDIQSEQSKREATQTRSINRVTDTMKDLTESGSGGSICLGSFLKGPVSSPICVTHPQVSPVPDGDRNTPPWAAHSTSPVVSRPSLRNIQMQQEKYHQNLSHSPNQGSPSDTGGVNRWFKPETDAPPSSIRSIQIEERAIKDLKRFYSNVKLVKTQP